jgi:hypothetical protein
MHAIHHRASEIGTTLAEQVDAVGQGFLLLDIEGAPPVQEFVRDLDVPHP